MDDYGFAEFFAQYWWLLFPLAFFIAAAWNSFMRYKRTQAKIDLIKSYTASGQEPPRELVESLDRDRDPNDWTGLSDDESARSGGGGGYAFLIFLFAGLAAVFGYAGYSGMFNGVSEEFYFVAAVMAVLSLSFLAAVIFRGRRK